MINIITNFNRAYRTVADRNRAIKHMFKASAGQTNYFVCYRDTAGGDQHPYALQFGHADWVKPGTGAYINR